MGEKQKVKEVFRENRTLVSIIITVIVIMWGISTLGLLLVVLQIWPNLKPVGAELRNEICLFYAVESFVLMLVVSIYHLWTFIRRRKRSVDREK